MTPEHFLQILMLEALCYIILTATTRVTEVCRFMQKLKLQIWYQTSNRILFFFCFLFYHWRTTHEVLLPLRKLLACLDHKELANCLSFTQCELALFVTSLSACIISWKISLHTADGAIRTHYLPQRKETIVPLA